MEVKLPRGVGTLLAFVQAPEEGSLQVVVADTVAGGEQLTVELARVAGDGRPVRTSHTFRVRVLGPDGQIYSACAFRPVSDSVDEMR